jgi:hypothetical protein
MAKDGTDGNVKDFLFDEESWVIRYLDGDLGEIFTGKRILIPRTSLTEIDWVNRNFLVRLNKSEIQKSPQIEDNLPISRQYEQKLLKHYQTKDYWARSYYPPTGAPTITHASKEWFGPKKVTSTTKVFNEEDLDNSLRSFKEIQGYQIDGLDGIVGHIDDIIIEEEDWRICYAIVETGSWFSSKKILIGTVWMEEISYVDQKIKINLSIESIKNAPTIDFLLLNDEFEKELYDYYCESKTPENRGFMLNMILF